MNRYMNCEYYPNFHVNIIKKGSFRGVPSVTLSDLGFPVDTDYRNQSLDDVSEKKKEEIIAEFIFLIERLLPRKIQDLFYRIALEPRTAYWDAFDMAAKRMQLERYTDPRKNNYGQFVNHVQSGIMDMMEEGMSLQDIYDSTCVTKQMLIDTVDSLFISSDYDTKNYERWSLIPLERILFGIKGISYRLDDKFRTVTVYRDDIEALSVIIVNYAYYIRLDESLYYSEEVIDKECEAEEYRDHVERVVSDFENNNIPAIIIDPVYYCDMDGMIELRKIICHSIGDIDYARTHNENIKRVLSEDTNEIDDETEDALVSERVKRVPISKQENEYIFVNVSFEWSEKTYCYLCDDEYIKEGDAVMVPVGRYGERKSAIVDSVELHTEKDAPYPIEKCKKIVGRV